MEHLEVQIEAALQCGQGGAAAVSGSAAYSDFNSSGAFNSDHSHSSHRQQQYAPSEFAGVPSDGPSVGAGSHYAAGKSYGPGPQYSAANSTSATSAGCESRGPSGGWEGYDVQQQVKEQQFFCDPVPPPMQQQYQQQYQQQHQFEDHQQQQYQQQYEDQQYYPQQMGAAAPAGAPMCHCGTPASINTSRQERSMGCKFYSCAHPRDSPSNCGFFEWENPDEVQSLPSHTAAGGPAADQSGQKDHMIELQSRFGHRGYRLGQKECVEAALSGRDVFCLMPTGGGKSIVYQLPAWCCPGIAVVFSPLVSLIQDQVDAMKAIGIRAVFLSSAQSNQDIQSLISEMRGYCFNSSVTSFCEQDDEQLVKMLYITPEKFSKSDQLRRLLELLSQKRLLSRFVIDETHCLSQWGHDFRPDYLQLKRLRELYPQVPIMALTATANQSVVADCMRTLGMRNPFLHTQSFDRKNLRYSVKRKESDKKVIQEIGDFVLRKRDKSGIIYCLSKKDCEQLANDLKRQIPAMRNQITYYHADLAATDKERRQRSWSKGDIKVIW